MKQSQNNRDPYEILGVGVNATDEEIKLAYRTLVKKYHPDGYDDNPLQELANDKMKEINWAYDEIQRQRADAKNNPYSGQGTYYQSYQGADNNQGGNNGGAYDPIYAEIRADINSRKFLDAERKLLNIAPALRVAEWHYLISLVLMSRNNCADAMRELEIACSLDPSNMEYQKAKQMFNTNANTYGNTYYGSANYGAQQRYRGGRSSADEACDCCSNLICLDCLCECMGGDLIPCC